MSKHFDYELVEAEFLMVAFVETLCRLGIDISTKPRRKLYNDAGWMYENYVRQNQCRRHR